MMLRDDMVKAGMDAVAVVVAVGSVAQYLPPLAALLTIIWTGIRIYESKTVQGWLGRDR